MLYFRSEDNIPQWSKANNMPIGAILSVEQLWALSKAWYFDRLDADYTGRNAAELMDLFASVGLTGDFWRI